MVKEEHQTNDPSERPTLHLDPTLDDRALTKHEELERTLVVPIDAAQVRRRNPARVVRVARKQYLRRAIGHLAEPVG